MSNIKKTKFVKGDFPSDLYPVFKEICKYFKEKPVDKISLEKFIEYCKSKKVDILISENTIKCNWEPDAFIDNAIQIKEIKDRVEPIDDFPL